MHVRARIEEIDGGVFLLLDVHARRLERRKAGNAR